MNQVLDSERIEEFSRICGNLGSGQSELLRKDVYDFIAGALLVQQPPDPEAYGIKAEADALVDIKQHRSVF